MLPHFSSAPFGAPTLRTFRAPFTPRKPRGYNLAPLSQKTRRFRHFIGDSSSEELPRSFLQPLRGAILIGEMGLLQLPTGVLRSIAP